MSDEVGSVVNGKFFTVFVLHESEVLLDVVSESEDITMLSSNSHELLPIEVPDFIVIVFHSKYGVWVVSISRHDDVVFTLESDEGIHYF